MNPSALNTLFNYAFFYALKNPEASSGFFVLYTPDSLLPEEEFLFLA